MNSLTAQAEAAFWEDKCHALLRELEAAHDVSQVRDVPLAAPISARHCDSQTNQSFGA